MVNIGVSSPSLAGIVLVVLGLIVLALALIILVRNPRSSGAIVGLIQDLALAFTYLVSGGILFFQAWRQDPSLRFAQTLLILAIAYLSLKDLLLRLRR